MNVCRLARGFCAGCAASQHISAAPVVDSEGRLVGAINLHDLHLAGVG